MLLDVLTRLYRAGFWFAPSDERERWSDEATAMFRAVAADALNERGYTGLCLTACAETANLARALLASRLEARAQHDHHRARALRGDTMIRRWLYDVRRSLRALWSTRTTVGIAAGTLALGIGLSTAAFSLLDVILWRPVPYPDADRLVQLATFNPTQKFVMMGFYSPARLTAWRNQTDVFERVEGYDRPSLVYATDSGSELVTSALVTPGLLTMLGAAPELGRLFGPGDGRAGTTDIVLISDEFWRTHLARDPAVVGRDLALDGSHRRVVGVLPASFRFPSGDTAIWAPFDASEPPAGDTSAVARTLTPVARLAPSVTRDLAAVEARRRGGQIAAAVGEPGTTAEVYGLGSNIDDKTRQSLWVLVGAVGFVFLVVCANVANLALSRSLNSSRDFAVRAALGASRGDLVRETLIEHALVAGAGCLTGLGVAVALLRAATAVLPQTMTTTSYTTIGLDVRATAFALGLGSLAALLFGLPAALLASRPSMMGLLGATSRGSTSSARSQRLRSALVVVEVAVSTTLLIGAALMTRSLLKLESADKGFDAANLVSLRLGLPSAGYKDPATGDSFVLQAVQRLRATPGILMATTGSLPTDRRPLMLGSVEFSSQPGRPTPRLIVPMQEVPADYFSSLGMPFVAGRTFRPDDLPDAVVVSETFARQHWPSGRAVNGQFRREGQVWQTVIGVVGDIRSMTGEEDWSRLQTVYYQTGKAPQALRPIMPASSIADYRTIVVRATRPDEAATLAPQVVHSIDPSVVIARIARVDRLYADAIARPRTVFLLMTVFAGVGLALAMAGILAVLSYLVALRLREIGVRLALGARPRDIAQLVLGSGAVLTFLGLAIGLLLSLALVGVMRTQLYSVDPADPASFVIVPLVVIVTSLVASWRPARRAMQIDPVTLLKQE